VRRLIRKHELDPANIQGTGPGGRITRNDVLAAAEGRGAPATAPAPAAAPAAAPAPAAAAAPVQVKAAADGDTTVALNNIRKRTGEHMVRSQATSPHVLTAMEVDFEAVDRVRRAHRSAWKEQEGFSLTYLPFVARAVVDAVEDFPHVNASVGEGELVVHHAVHLAIAVDLDFEGLLAPVVRNTESKRLRAIAREIRDLADRAHQKKLSADEIAGGTFTITNPGQYGTMLQFPVINQPQVAILSTDGVHRKPVVVTGPDGTEAIAVHSVGVLALAWDHRAFDGAYAAAFLARLREIIETRDWEAEL
jgi:2-oxoglutarate dehydrogenase E2 component (dihydrolipoamide succinyltransferase)